MECSDQRHPGEGEGALEASIASGRPEVMPGPGLEEHLTSSVILDLLKIPQDSFVRISAALFFLGNREMFAFYWRDSYNNKEYCKFVSADAVRAAFEPMPFDSGYLPPHTLRFGITSSGERWLSMFVPPAPVELSVQDSDLGMQQVQVPLPGLVFTGRGKFYWIWAVKDEIPTAETIVYHAPLSNVGADGSICFGANPVPEADGPTMLQALHLFLASPFNGHWAAGKSRAFQGDVRYLLQDLAKQRPPSFPLDDLCPIISAREPERRITLDLLIKHMLSRR